MLIKQCRSCTEKDKPPSPSLLSPKASKLGAKAMEDHALHSCCYADVHFWILNGFADLLLIQRYHVSFFGICQCFWLLQLILHRSLTVCARFHWSPALTGAWARGGNWGRWVSSRSRLLRNRQSWHMIKQYQTCLLRMYVVSSWRALNKQDARLSWASLLRPCWVTCGYTALHGTRLDCGMKRWATCELNEEQMMGLLLLEDFCGRSCYRFFVVLVAIGFFGQ